MRSATTSKHWSRTVRSEGAGEHQKLWRERIDAIDNELGDANPMQRLRLTQERIDLVAKIEATETTVDISALEDEFVAVASAYGENNGISYAAWRAVGVSAAVLKRAGVSRSA